MYGERLNPVRALALRVLELELALRLERHGVDPLMPVMNIVQEEFGFKGTSEKILEQLSSLLEDLCNHMEKKGLTPTAAQERHDLEFPTA